MGDRAGDLQVPEDPPPVTQVTLVATQVIRPLTLVHIPTHPLTMAIAAHMAVIIIITAITILHLHTTPLLQIPPRHTILMITIHITIQQKRLDN